MFSSIDTYAKTSQEMLIRNIDASKFRGGLKISSAIQLIEFVMEGLLNKHLQEIIEAGAEGSLDLINRISWEINDFYELLKRGVHK